jgi:tetratricopeptide (TPR) repeat protein
MRGRTAVLVLGSALAAVLAAGTAASAQGSSDSALAPYQAPPLNLTVRVPSYDPEFDAREDGDFVYLGQTLVVHVTLENGWNEPIRVVTGSHRLELEMLPVNGETPHDPLPITGNWQDQLEMELWLDDEDIRVKTLTGPNSIDAHEILAPERPSPAPGVLSLGSRDTREVTRRFVPEFPFGEYRLRVRLQITSRRETGVEIPQDILAEMHLLFLFAESRNHQLELFYREATLARAEGRLQDAREQLSELLKTSPNSSAGRLLLGDVALKQGNTSQAREQYAYAKRILEGGLDVDSVALKEEPSAAKGRLTTVDQKLAALGPSHPAD